MVASALTQEMIQSGRTLVQQLDDSGISVNAALWLLFPEVQAWKLMLSTPTLVADGPKAAYDAVQKALSKISHPQLQLDDVVIAKPDAPLLKLMRLAIRTGSGIDSIRFTQNVINGQLIPDALIYRLQ